MAGIGFELRRLKRHNTFLGTLQAYYGMGYVLAAAIAFAITATRTNQLLGNLEYRIFTTNPFPKTSPSTS